MLLNPDDRVMNALRRLTQEHYLEDIRTVLRLYVQKKIWEIRTSECTKRLAACMTGVFYIWLVKSATYAMKRIQVSECFLGKDYKKIKSIQDLT